MDFVEQHPQSYQGLVARFLAKMGQPIDALSNIPGLLLAIAPAWYMFACSRAPKLYSQSSAVSKMVRETPYIYLQPPISNLRRRLWCLFWWESLPNSLYDLRFTASVSPGTML